ncbi:MAG: hypothetical protein M1817_000842 [Caeruleum heppii]|nr:MAG: hypothetical protein M1817_000842 [Caeruleum heppii]
MNTIREIQALNKREIENDVSTEASWHADYRDTAYIYIGGLPFDLSEGDVVTIFSQFGEPVHINLVRDKDTGKSKGFAFLKYEDQRSTDLAVDNLGGATIMGRVLKVDHTRYKRKDDEGPDDNLKDSIEDKSEDLANRQARDVDELGEDVQDRPLLPEERQLADLIATHDDDDPMKEYLIAQKREEVDAAKKKLGRSRRRDAKGRSRRRDAKEEKSDRRRHHHHRRRPH